MNKKKPAGSCNIFLAGCVTATFCFAEWHRWKGPLEVSGPTCCSKNRLLRVLSDWILSISTDKEICRQPELEEGGNVQWQAAVWDGQRVSSARLSSAALSTILSTHDLRVEVTPLSPSPTAVSYTGITDTRYSVCEVRLDSCREDSAPSKTTCKHKGGLSGQRGAAALQQWNGWTGHPWPVWLLRGRSVPKNTKPSCPLHFVLANISPKQRGERQKGFLSSKPGICANTEHKTLVKLSLKSMEIHPQFGFAFLNHTLSILGQLFVPECPLQVRTHDLGRG